MCIPAEIACTPARARPTSGPGVYPSPFSATDRARERAGACAHDCTPAHQEGRARRLRPRGTIARIEPLGRLVPGALRHRPGLFARPQGHSPQALVPRVHRSSARGPGDPAAPMLWLMHTKRASVQAKRRGYTPPPPTDADEDSVEGGFLPLENECTPARGEEDASKGAEDEGA